MTDMPEPRGKSIDLNIHFWQQPCQRQIETPFNEWVPYLHEHSFDPVYFQQATYNWDISFKCRVCGDETRNGKIHGIRYKFRMMGITIEGPSYIYGDNMLVIYNIQRPEITLSKKNNLIYYHAMRESVSMGESLTTHIPTGDNRAYLLTKVLHRRKRRYHVSNLLYNIYDDHILEHNWGVSHFEGLLWV